VDKLLTMSNREITRLEVMQRLKDKRLSQKEAARMLGISCAGWYTYTNGTFNFHLTAIGVHLTWDGPESALLRWLRNLRVASGSRMPSVAQADPIGNIEDLYAGCL